MWGIVSYVSLSEYKKIGDPQFLGDIFFLLSLLWAEFGFAAIFKEVYSRRYRHLTAYAVVTGSPKKERNKETTPYCTNMNDTPIRK